MKTVFTILAAVLVTQVSLADVRFLNPSPLNSEQKTQLLKEMAVRCPIAVAHDWTMYESATRVEKASPNQDYVETSYETYLTVYGEDIWEQQPENGEIIVQSVKLAQPDPQTHSSYKVVDFLGSMCR